MDILIFEQITSALTIKSICSSLGPDIPAGSTGDDLNMMYCDPDLDPLVNPSRVVASNGSVMGIVWFEDLWQLENSEGARTVEDVMQRLVPSEILSSSTTILEAVELFCKSHNRFFYVLHVNEVIGVVFYSDLFRPLGRLAFLALALEIEELALALCRSPSVNRNCWQCLSEKRKLKAIELFKFRYARDPRQEEARQNDGIIFLPRPPSDISLLIGCTNLVDKATMIWKQRLVSAAKQAEVLGFFNDLKEVRDQCAHPGLDQELLARGKLGDFINAAKRMRDSLAKAVQSAGASDGHGSRL